MLWPLTYDPWPWKINELRALSLLMCVPNLKTHPMIGALRSGQKTQWHLSKVPSLFWCTWPPSQVVEWVVGPGRIMLSFYPVSRMYFELSCSHHWCQKQETLKINQILNCDKKQTFVKQPHKGHSHNKFHGFKLKQGTRGCTSLPEA